MPEVTPTPVEWTQVQDDIFFRADDVILALYKQGYGEMAKEFEKLKERLRNA